jgi:hypothetical protein
MTIQKTKEIKMIIQFMCGKHRSVIKECSIFKLHDFWKRWIEEGIRALQSYNSSKSLFYFGNARDVSVTEFEKNELLNDAIPHLATSTLLTARVLHNINQLEMEQLCLSETFQFLGKRLHLAQYNPQLQCAMGALLDRGQHENYINDVLQSEFIRLAIDLPNNKSPSKTQFTENVLH